MKKAGWRSCRSPDLKFQGRRATELNRGTPGVLAYFGKDSSSAISTLANQIPDPARSSCSVDCATFYQVGKMFTAPAQSFFCKGFARKRTSKVNATVFMFRRKACCFRSFGFMACYLSNVPREQRSERIASANRIPAYNCALGLSHSRPMTIRIPTV